MSRAASPLALLIAALLAASALSGGPLAPAAEARLTAKKIVKDFKRSGLPVGRHWRMRADDYGIGMRPPSGTTARRFTIPSLCDEYERPCDAGGRVFVFKRWADLKRQRAYYQAFGDRYGDVLFSWTFVNRRKTILVQINGELRPRKAKRYRRAIKRYARASASTATAHVAGSCSPVSAGGRRATRIRVTNLTCRTARRKLHKWMRQGYFPQGYRWWCGRASDSRWICSAGNGGYAPHFRFRLGA